MFCFVEIKDEEIFSSLAATEVSTPGVLAGGNEGVEQTEATQENEPNGEMEPLVLTSNNLSSISTQERTYLLFPILLLVN